MDYVDQIVGDQIAARRTAMALSVDQLGDSAGIGGQQIRAYEAGRSRVPASHLAKLADALEVDAAFFFFLPEGTPDRAIREADRLFVDDQTLDDQTLNNQTMGDRTIEDQPFGLARAMTALAGIRNERLRDALVTIIEEIARIESGRVTSPSRRGA